MQTPSDKIPLHYHYNMLQDTIRMGSFKTAIQQVVKPGMRVLELGGGSGVLSCWAAQMGAKVWCVEIDENLSQVSRQLLETNGVLNQVEVVCADASQYVPPESIDVVICEMLHVGLLRERIARVLTSFKSAYLKKWGGQLPLMIPSASLLGVQPIQQNFDFLGFKAPVLMFQQPDCQQPRTQQLGGAVNTHIIDYSSEIPSSIQWRGDLTLSETGSWNALRFITKNILAISLKDGKTVDWFNQYLIVPLAKPVNVTQGDVRRLAFSYQAGSEINALQNSIVIE